MLVAIAVATFVLLGLADGSLGVAWPSMRGTFGRGLSELGVLLAFGSIGYLSASIAYGRVHGRVGTGGALTLGAALMTVGLVGVAAASAWGLLAASVLAFGVGGGLIDSGMNAHAALAFDVRSINLLHAAYGVGATLGPIVITASLAFEGTWRSGYAGIAVLQLASLTMVFRSRRRWTADASMTVDREALAGRRRRTTLLTLALFLVYTGVEVAAGQWAFTLLSEGREMTTASAGAWVAAYWGGLTAGRLLFSVVGHRFAPSRLLDGSAAVAIAGLGLLWWDPWSIGFVGLPIAGLGFAAVFPTLVSLTPARIGRDKSTAMVGYQLAAANIGAASVPWVMGLVAESGSLASLGPALFAGSVALGALHLATDRIR